ncbi:MAG TPA: phosphoribosylformylglycinamidine cyclo-ligase [Firmicutes bacterium]|nr:phosphoribosylformylglycinamidine cyclo-ligase [Bacillota bacterium]
MSEAYKNAGVNLQAGYETVARIKKHIERTKRIGVAGAVGGFGGLFDLDALGYRHPVLVSGTDGVGTKIMIAFMLDKHDTIGIDAVAMCVNDVVVQGAEPLFFLDYLACGKNDPRRTEEIVAGVAEGCVQAGCALIGGETAEMPGLYGEGEYDIAGFTVGVCERENLVDGSTIVPGDILLGLPSNGLHSNGYSLVRKVLLGKHKVSLQTYVPELGCSWGEELLKPTRIYVKSLLPLLKEGTLKGLAHITGGGFVENVPRMLPDGLGVSLDLDSWERPAIFTLLEELGEIPRSEMYNVFNMGIGMVLAVAPSNLETSLAYFQALGETVYRIGEVTKDEGVQLV